MKINRKKSGIIFHQKRYKKVEEGEQLLGYPIKEKYKYLGVYLDINLRFKFQLEEVKRRMEKGLKMVKMMLWKQMEHWRITYI